jgi:hypothetical protein
LDGLVVGVDAVELIVVRVALILLSAFRQFSTGGS